MSYKRYEAQSVHKLSDLTEQEQAYIRKEWDRLCSRETVNTPESVFIQKADGHFFKATRGRIAAVRHFGSAGGFWFVKYGVCNRWGFKKNVMGQYDPEPMDKSFSSTNRTGETIAIPSKVHTKKEVLDLAKKLGFEL